MLEVNVSSVSALNSSLKSAISSFESSARNYNVSISCSDSIIKGMLDNYSQGIENDLNRIVNKLNSFGSVIDKALSIIEEVDELYANFHIEPIEVPDALAGLSLLTPDDISWYTDPSSIKLPKVFNVLKDYMVGVTKSVVTNGNPQGLTEFGDYIVGSNSNGSLFIYNKVTGESKEIVLDKNSHLGGIAYGGGYLYTANNNNVTRYDFDELLNGNIVSKDYSSVITQNNSQTAQVSFLTVTDDGKLITGQFHMAGNGKYDRGGAASDLIVYDIDEKGDLTQTGTIKVPKDMTKIQGACVYNYNGQDYYVLTSSYGTSDSNTSTMYIATLSEDGKTLKKQGSIKLPAGAEQVTVTSDKKLAVTYEGKSSKSNITILDFDEIVYDI